MRMFVMAVVVLALSVEAQAKVWMTVYRHDGKTLLAPVDPNHPHVYADIMVGTKLVVVVCSDTDLDFSGFLQFPDDGVMSLAGRGYNPKRRLYADSSLPAAGEYGEVRSRDNAGIKGFGLVTDFFPSSGDWFIFDYCAERIGSCNLYLYDDSLYDYESKQWGMPVDIVSFSHVPSCDFNHDNMVDFRDLAILTSCNLSVPTSIASDQDTAFDLNADHVIDAGDLARFSEHWLEQIAPIDPNQPSDL